MMRIVVLLYHLFTGVDSSATNLRQKLMVAPRRIYSGLWHMFTVTLGRISYAPPPESISPEDQVKLEQICGTSLQYRLMYQDCKALTLNRPVYRPCEGRVGTSRRRPRARVHLGCVSRRGQCLGAAGDAGGRRRGRRGRRYVTRLPRMSCT